MEKRETPLNKEQERMLRIILLVVYMRGGANLKEDVAKYVDLVMKEVMQVLSDNTNNHDRD